MTYAFTVWHARWAYFFVLVLAMLLPTAVSVIERRWLGWIVTTLAFLPILQEWDKRLWPNEATIARDSQQRSEAVQWRDLATQLRSKDRNHFSRHGGFPPQLLNGRVSLRLTEVHDSLSGITDSARFFLATDPTVAQEILRKHNVVWVLVGDADDVIENSAAIFHSAQPANPLARVLTRMPDQAPPFLSLAGQNGGEKIYRVTSSQ